MIRIYLYLKSVIDKMWITLRKKHRPQNLHSKYTCARRSSISDRVLCNPELLECILMHMPERDLLVNAQRVGKLWHSTITVSPTLQQILYFQPISSMKITIKSMVNPLLLSAFPPWFQSFDYDAPPQSIKRLDFRNLDWNSCKVKQEAYRREDASWRRMLVVQPPVSNISATIEWCFQESTECLAGNAAVLQGLRMGLLYDLAQTAAYAFEHGFFEFWLDWRRPDPSLSSKDSDTIKAERISLHIDQINLMDCGLETPLEKEFRSLAAPEDPLVFFKWTSRSRRGPRRAPVGTINPGTGRPWVFLAGIF